MTLDEELEESENQRMKCTLRTDGSPARGGS
jgi:hypothetical protein